MDHSCLTPLEIYINKVFKNLIVIIPSITLCAGLTFSVLHILGYYPDIPNTAMLIFDISCVIYTLIGIRFYRTCEDAVGQIKPGVLKAGKCFIAVLEIIQWNFITYMVPSRDFWAYAFFFVLLSSSFLDSRYVLIIICEVTGSMFLSWFIRPDALLPVRDALFVPEIVLRCVLTVLCMMSIWAITRTIEKRLASELEKISDLDTLTLLYNRRKLSKDLQNVAAKGDWSVIMADIDDFKAVNDTHGHSCGDAVLRDVANILRSAAATKGTVYRYGGEELLVLVNGGEEEAFALAEDIRKRIQGHRTLYENLSIGVTMTFGVAARIGTEAYNELIERADANLYYGKKHGKNCVIR